MLVAAKNALMRQIAGFLFVCLWKTTPKAHRHCITMTKSNATNASTYANIRSTVSIKSKKDQQLKQGRQITNAEEQCV